MIGFYWFLGPLLLATVLTWCVRQFSLIRGKLDMPNERSSHHKPTPRGGGLAFAAILVLISMSFYAQGGMDATVASSFALGGLIVASMGYVDDIRSLPVMPRLLAHLVSAVLGVVLLSTVYPAYSISWAQLMLMFVFAAGIIWSINLFNFMDGIDGLAASEAVFISAASAILASPITGAESSLVFLCIATAGSCVGFLVWNWPPASIFMGDVGSGFLGYWLSLLAVALHLEGSLPIWTSATVGSLFIADATTTLLRRLLRGERWQQAHRSHAYQILAHRWRSHRRVTVLASTINVILVLPTAYLSVKWTDAAPFIAIAMLVTMSLCCLAVGAGRADSTGTIRATSH